MTNAINGTTFTKVMKTKRIVQDFTTLLTELHQKGIGTSTHSLLPTFVELQFPKTLNQQDALVIREILTQLRPFQLSHFLRFCGDLDWVMDADCADIFYSHDVKKHLHRDVIIRLDVLNPGRTDLHVTIPHIKRSHLTIQEISRACWSSFPGLVDEDTVDDVYDVMTYYHRQHGFLDKVSGLNDDCHILFVPSYDEKRVYPIPLFGLTGQDAKRRSVYTDKCFDFLKYKHHDVIGEEVFIQEIIHHLVLAIQDQEEREDRTVSGSQTYAFAEILFGYYLRMHEQTNASRKEKCHELIWFENVTDADDGQDYIDTFSMNVSNLNY